VMAMSMPRDELDLLLAEYQCAHMNRDHYDSVRWVIGSIFIAGSFALFGISFIEPAAGAAALVVLLAISSIGLFAVFAAYHLHVEPYVKLSIARLQTIEKELQTCGYVSPLPDSELELFEVYQRDPKKLIKLIPRLHTIIQEVAKRGRGKPILWLLTLVLVAAWLLRVVPFFWRCGCI